MSITKFETLHCEIGDHDYDRPVKRGVKPKNCDAHKPKPEVKPRTPGVENLKSKIRQALKLADERHMPCRCGLNEDMSRDELTALKAGCTASPTGPNILAGSHGGFVCPVLDSVRRAIGYADYREDEQ